MRRFHRWSTLQTGLAVFGVLSMLGGGAQAFAQQDRRPQSTSRCVDTLRSITDEPSYLPESEKLIAEEFNRLRLRLATDEHADETTLTWADSDARALYLYQHLDELGERAPALFDHLLKASPYFAEARRVLGTERTLMTFAFEKETHSLSVLLYYKTTAYGDAEWFKLPAPLRDQKLRRAIRNRAIPRWLRRLFRQVMPAPTGAKPDFLGAPTEEVPMLDLRTQRFNSGLPPIEFKHRRFEISLERTLKQIEKVSKDIGETDAFHLHLVFELPVQYPAMFKFSAWVKAVNDFLTLSGFEEGLHGTALTEIAAFDDLPDSPALIGALNHKYYSAGVRGMIYGKSNNPGFVRIGIELRDATRHLEILRTISTALADAISRRAWEQIDLRAVSIFAVDPSGPGLKAAASDALETGGASESWIARIRSLEPNLGIPLTPFEAKAERAEMPMSKATRERLEHARQKYQEDLAQLGAEIARMEDLHEPIADDDVRMAVKMIISQWAKAARPSEVYRPLSLGVGRELTPGAKK